jgi:hypothetical protein
MLHEAFYLFRLIHQKSSLGIAKTQRKCTNAIPTKSMVLKRIAGSPCHRNGL